MSLPDCLRYAKDNKIYGRCHKWNTKAVEESADGVTSAAMSVDSLVADMNDVNKEMDTNQNVSDKLRKETECFVKL